MKKSQKVLLFQCKYKHLPAYSQKNPHKPALVTPCCVLSPVFKWYGIQVLVSAGGLFADGGVGAEAGCEVGGEVEGER